MVAIVKAAVVDKILSGIRFSLYSEGMFGPHSLAFSIESLICTKVKGHMISSEVKADKFWSTYKTTVLRYIQIYTLLTT